MKLYLFFREEGFYPIELRDDAEAIENAEYNKGTIKVEDVCGGLIWVNPTQVVEQTLDKRDTH